MVIDKSTGRGCALSIVSKTVTKQLIAENIMNKVICKKSSQNRHSFRVGKFAGEVCVMVQRSEQVADEPLWTPSFIDTDIWTKAVSKFQNFVRLDKNVERHLLPEMDEYLENISDTELISMTRDFLIGHGIINTPVSQRAVDTYYFNESEIYSLDKKSGLFTYEKPMKFGMFEVRGETCFNMNVWHKAVSQFEIGATLEECINIFLNTDLVNHVPQGILPVDRLIQYISPVEYERVPENQNEDTFDRIRVTVGIPRYQNSWEALINEVKKYRYEIYQRVVQKLKNDYQYEKYGVPLNFLKLSSVMLLRDCSIEFIFELKEPR